MSNKQNISMDSDGFAICLLQNHSHQTFFCRFKISFSPSETGVHYVSLKHKGLHIPGGLMKLGNFSLFVNFTLEKFRFKRFESLENLYMRDLIF